MTVGEFGYPDVEFWFIVMEVVEVCYGLVDVFFSFIFGNNSWEVKRLVTGSVAVN